MSGDTVWLTVTEIARRLGRPESTVRYWRNRFRDALPERVGPDGHALYPLAALAEVERLVSEHFAPREIRAELQHRYPAETATPPAPADPWQAAVLDRLDRILAAVERIAARLEQREEE